jgi:histidine ammonia-lyase
LRRHVPGPGPDRHLAPDIESAVLAVRSGELLTEVEAAVGALQ